MRRLFLLALCRQPSDEEVAWTGELLGEDVGQHAARIVNVAHTLLMSNEFFYVD